MSNRRLIELAPLPEDVRPRMSSTVQINDHQIAYADTQPYQSNVYIYDVNKDDWSPYSPEVTAMWTQTNGGDPYERPRRFAYDSSTKMLYWASDTHIAGVNTVNDRVWRANKRKRIPGYTRDRNMLAINGHIHFMSSEQHEIISTKPWQTLSPQRFMPHTYGMRHSCKVLQNARLSECDVRVHSEALVQNVMFRTRPESRDSKTVKSRALARDFTRFRILESSWPSSERAFL